MSRRHEEWQLAVNALALLAPGRADDRATWIRVGMALHAVSPDLFPEWEEWSHQSEKFTEGECARQWRGFKSGGGVGLGTLVHFARQDGDADFARGCADEALALESAIEFQAQKLGSPGGRWPYHDAEGRLVAWVVRFDKDGDKTFRPFTPTGDRWVCKGLTGMRPLYRLPELLASTGVVVVSEGEAATDAVVSGGLTATTSMGGSSQAGRTDWSPLAGRDVVILPDNDAAGEQYLASVQAELARLSPPAAVRVVRLPGLPSKGDAVEFFNARKEAGKQPQEIGQEILALAATETPEVASPRGKPALVVKARRFIDDIESGRDPNEAWSAFSRATCKDLSHGDGAEAVTVRLSDVEPEAVKWIWNARLPLGKLSLLAGDPGLGKSTLTLEIAARVTRGSDWPDGAPGSAPGNVLLLSAEDDPADTIRPRLDAAGGDPARVRVIKAVRVSDASGAPRERTFSLALDLPRLEALLEKDRRIRLVIVDPLSAYLGSDVDSHRNSDVRGLLAPLADLAARHGVAVLVLMHLNKGAGSNAMYRTQGSIAFVAAVRIGWVVGPDKDDDDRKLLVQIKNNIGPDPGGLAYRIESTPCAHGGSTGRIRWDEGRVDVTAEELLSGQGAAKPPTKLEDAVRWVRLYLAKGPREVEGLFLDAEEAGHARRTIERAKKKLYVEGWAGAFGGKWLCALPQHCPAAQSPPKGAAELGGDCVEGVSAQSPPIVPQLNYLAETGETAPEGSVAGVENEQSFSVRQPPESGEDLEETGGDCGAGLNGVADAQLWNDAAGEGGVGREDAPSRRCATCDSYFWWRRRTGGRNWVCGLCNPNLPSRDLIDVVGGEDE